MKSRRPTARKVHAQFRTAGVISIFLGDFGRESELDGYLEKRFACDFGFEIEPRDGPECSCHRTAQDVRSLLSGASWHETFADAAAAVARERGVLRAKCALVFYNFEYCPTDTAPKSAKLVFIGTFAFTANSS